MDRDLRAAKGFKAFCAEFIPRLSFIFAIFSMALFGFASRANAQSNYQFATRAEAMAACDSQNPSTWINPLQQPPYTVFYLPGCTILRRLHLRMAMSRLSTITVLRGTALSRIIATRKWVGTAVGTCTLVLA